MQNTCRSNRCEIHICSSLVVTKLNFSSVGWRTRSQLLWRSKTFRLWIQIQVDSSHVRLAGIVPIDFYLWGYVKNQA